jgi:hypothetical protein
MSGVVRAGIDCRPCLRYPRNSRLIELLSFAYRIADIHSGNVLENFEFSMIVEQRIYTIKPGLVPQYLELYEAEGLAVQSRILGNLIGYYSAEVGELSQIIHMWGYKDMNDRTVRRAELYGDPEWQAVVTRLFEMIDRMENRILIPTKFSPTPA